MSKPPPTHQTETMSDRRSARELAEARQSGSAPPEIDVNTGAMINPHNPEFITRRPWYLGGGDDGPSLNHQADQRKEEDKVELSMTEADRLVREERGRVKQRLDRQNKKRSERRSSSKSRSDALTEDDLDLFVLGSYIEALKKNKRPYLICRVVKIAEKGRAFDLEYEDGFIERGVRPLGDKRRRGGGGSGSMPRMKVTKTGARSIQINPLTSGKETYDSKRDSYHGVELGGHQRKMERRFQDKETLRKEQREDAKKKQQQEEEEGKMDLSKLGEPQQQNNHNSDSDSDSDSDAGSGESEDEFVQDDEDAKMFASRLARQGGVGGAQMKVTARNLRIREDTAKYLRNLDPNSAYYDPKSRSMRDNPNQGADPEEVPFAGDNYARISGDAVGLADTQLFAWDAAKKGASALHPQADPSRAELLKREFRSRGEDFKAKKRRTVLDKYGGEEYLDGTAGKGKSRGAGLGRVVAPEDAAAAARERATRFGVAHAEEEYARSTGRAKTGGVGDKQKRVAIPSKYEEDNISNGHVAVWGSYFHKGAFKWGFGDDHSLVKSGYGTGPNGRIANDEANELRYGTGKAGSALLASARRMLQAVPESERRKLQKDNDGESNEPHQQSKLYGQAVDQHKNYDEDKVRAALEKQKQQEEDQTRDDEGGKGKRQKYNSTRADDVNVTEEDMEAYRISRGRGTEDPMAKLAAEGEILEYTK